MGRHGFFARRCEDVPAGGTAPTGKFGRMFPNLPAFTPDPESLKLLGETMVDKGVDVVDETGTTLRRDNPEGDNPAIATGYTYLGQFIDHDITFDLTPLHDAQVDPRAVRNFRTPGLDLDSLYGAGPEIQPYLYAAERGSQKKFLIGQTTPSPTGRRTNGQTEQLLAMPNDLPRAPQSQPQISLALIGDPRNDENLIVAQMHVAFLKFHNKVVEGLENGSIPRDPSSNRSVFEEAREIVTWHYQWIVVNDFLSRILDKNQLNQVLYKGRRYYHFHADPFIPVEFSAAAYRLGHSMVRMVYDYNRVFTTKPTDSRFTDATLELLFEFTGKSGNSDTPPGLNPTVPSNWIIDWRLFFDVEDSIKADLSRKLDPYLAEPLTNLPNVPAPNSLAVRNLLRGRSLGLPSGQSVAKYMGFKPLRPQAIASCSADGRVAAQVGFDVESPLWYYILKEAEIQAQGKHLGEVGSRIVAEVFIGLLEGDKTSYLVKKPDWKPTLPAKVPGTFTMADLLRYVKDLNPIGD